MRNRGRRNSNERGGSADRRARKMWLLQQHGRFVLTGEPGLWRGWVAQCWQCSTLVTFATMIVDRIIPGEQQGTYRRNNIRIHCPGCSGRQGQRRTTELRVKAKGA